MCAKMIYLCFVLLLSLAGFVRGSCLEYGHSCWGAHGKRSGGKIYRSIEGSESEQSEANRDIPLTQDKLKPRELFSFLLDRNGRINMEDAKIPLESSVHNENENMFDASERRLRRKLKNAIRKSTFFQLQPKTNDYTGSTESSAVRRNPSRPSAGSSSEYYQVENYPSLNLEMEYLDLK